MGGSVSGGRGGGRERRLGCRVPPGRPTIARGLQSDDPDERIQAVIRAGRTRDESVLPLLVERLEDRDEAVRMFAIASLERIAGTRRGYQYYGSPDERPRPWGDGASGCGSGRRVREVPDGVETLPGNAIRLSMASSPALLPVVRAALEEFARQAGFDETECGKIVLSADEALTNIIRHAYAGATDRPIEVRSAALDGQGGLRIGLRDWAQPVEPGRIKVARTSDLRPGGLGVHIMNRCMDEVRVRGRPTAAARA